MISGITPQLSEAGKIKIGCKGEMIASSKGTKFRPPVKLDHFIVTRNERDKDDNLILDDELMTELSMRTGEKAIKSIPIVLHSNEIDEVFPTSYAAYSGKRVSCRGDGEKALCWMAKDAKGNLARSENPREVKCPCRYLKDRTCKPHGTLHCSIVVPGHAIAGAVYKWRTTSIISIERMIGSLQQILAVCGSLQGIPLCLKLEPVRVEKGTVYCCHVELRATDLLEVQRKALEISQMRAALGGPSMGSYKALISPPASDNEPEEESADVQEEFYPDIIMPDTGEVITSRKKFNAPSSNEWGFGEFEYQSEDAIAE